MMTLKRIVDKGKFWVFGLCLGAQLFLPQAKIEAACSHTYVDVYQGASMTNMQSVHEFQDSLTKEWKTCTRTIGMDVYQMKCSKCGHVSNTYTTQFYAHSNSRCSYYPRSTAY